MGPCFGVGGFVMDTVLFGSAGAVVFGSAGAMRRNRLIWSIPRPAWINISAPPRSFCKALTVTGGPSRMDHATGGT